jgi:hypothetical protein
MQRGHAGTTLTPLQSRVLTMSLKHNILNTFQNIAAPLLPNLNHPTIEYLKQTLISKTINHEKSSQLNTDPFQNFQIFS